MLNIEPRYIGGRDGKRLRTAVFDAAPGTAPRGVCALFNGQTEFIEKYGEVIGELTGRGFKVAALDWRGQGGSARALADPLKVHIDDFAQYDEDLAAFMDMVVRPISPDPPIAIAHSMGGHILFRALAAKPKQFAAAVFSAPMVMMQLGGTPRPLARALSWLQTLRGRNGDFALGQGKFDPLNRSFAEQRVTSDPERYERTKGILRQFPALRTAGSTWGWLEAALKSVRASERRGFAEAITTPVLVMGAGRDRIVHTAATEAFVKRLPNGRFVNIEEAEHEILMERDPIRARFWVEFDGFIYRL